MSLTNITIIRNHLFRIQTGEESHRNIAIRLSSEYFTQLPHTRLKTSSEQLKAIEQMEPLTELISVASSPAPLSHQEIVSATFVCASDSSLSQVYQEHIDYSVDYITGTINRLGEGSIPADATVRVWYLYYRIYQRNIDFSVDYEKGRIRRINSGNIEDGQELLVDYLTGDIDFSDAEIEQCIKEAEAELLLSIDSLHVNSIDPALQTAATSLTMSYVSRNTAGAVHAASNDAGQTAGYWLNLAASYRDTAMRLLSWYRPSIPSLHSPRKI